MITLGIDAHKRTHTVVVVDELGRELGQKTTTATTSEDHLDLVRWADRFGPDRQWAVEDCRHLSRRLEADMLAAGERIVRVPPKLMAHARDSARTYGKSDPIDALAVARAALREPDLPVAQLDGPAREVRLLVDHREDLVAERTRCINRLRWHLHELDASWDPPARSLASYKNLDTIAARLEDSDGPVARIACDIVAHIQDLTVRERALEREITALVRTLAPALLALAGVGALTAAKIVAETADLRRFHSKDAFARHNGTAPLPVWSANRERHRLSRTGNRQLNAAIHRIAITQMRCSDDAKTYPERRRARRRRDRRRSGGRCPPTSTSTRPGADEAPFGSVPSVLSPANAPHHPVHPSQCPGGTVNRRILLSLLSILALAGVASCSSGDGDAASAGDGRPDETPVETRAEAGEDRAGDDADNPVVFGYEVDGPAGTTAVVVSTLVAQGQEQPPFTATWSITDRPRWALYTNWIESGEIEVEVTEGGPAVVRVIRARYVDPDDPFAGIDEIEEVDTFEVGSSSTGSIEFP